MTTQPDFAVDVYQNEYLPDGATDVNAILTVTAAGGDPGATAGQQTVEAAEVIIVDTSGSMQYPPTKISAARQATAAAIDTLRDGVAFAVVAGSHQAQMVYPYGQRLVPATDHSRAEAKAAVAGLEPTGGTAIGQWLTLANSL